MRVYLFDVCGTLFCDDTTLGFLNYLCREKLGHRIFLGCISHRGSPLRWGLALLERVTGRAWIRDLALLILKGWSRADLEARAHSYVEYLLAERRQPQPFQLFEQALSSAQVLLVSASLEPVVEALARRFGIGFVASELAWDGLLCRGHLERDISGQKAAAIVAKFGPDYIGLGCHCVTDNFSDRSLLQQCQGRTVILCRPGHRAFWSGLETEFIEVFV